MANKIIGGIYKIENLVNGKCYIGSSVSLNKRLHLHRCHLWKNQHHSIKLQRAWNRYGADSFSMLVVEIVADKTCLIAREQWWIDHENCIALGYNIAPTAGSCLGRKHTEDTRAKMSLSAKGRVISYQARIRMSIAGKNRPPTTTATRAKLSLAGKRPCSAETRAKISASNTGKTPNAETRAKLSLAGKRESLSAETIAKMSAAQKGRIVSGATRLKMSLAAKGKPKSIISIAKMVATRLANKLLKQQEATQ